MPYTPSVQAQYNNVISRVYDQPENALRIVGDINIKPGDIEIGAVEIKDHITDIRTAVDSTNALKVREAQLETSINQYSSGTGTAGVLTDILTYTVPTGKTFYIEGYIATGEAEARFEVTVDSVVKTAYRITRADLTAEVNFGKAPIVALADSVVKVRVENHYNTNLTFETNIYGYLI